APFSWCRRGPRAVARPPRRAVLVAQGRGMLVYSQGRGGGGGGGRGAAQRGAPRISRGDWICARGRLPPPRRAAPAERQGGACVGGAWGLGPRTSAKQYLYHGVAQGVGTDACVPRGRQGGVVRPVHGAWQDPQGAGRISRSAGVGDRRR